MARKLAGVSSAAPTRELGSILQGNFSFGGMEPWYNFVDDQEFVPELMWPRSIRTYSVMRSDSQVSALCKALSLPLRRRTSWMIDPNGVDDNARVERLAKNLNLPIKGENKKPMPRTSQGRKKGRFVWQDHLRKLLYAGFYGHYYFEQVGFIDKDGYWSLKKLAERPPHTINNFRISPDGGLISIVQNVWPTPYPRGGANWNTPLPEIPIDNLVGYVWEHEGANWAGRSWLRDIYKNWLLKDRLMRVDAVNHERAGGIPYIEGHPGATQGELREMNEMAQNIRVGDTSGAAVPFGAKVQIAKAGNTDVVSSLRYHDESMARNFLLMILQLGQTRTGSRNLGSNFTEFWSQGVNVVGDWVVDTFSAYVIEDYWDWNYGEDEEITPLLAFESEPELNAADLTNMIKVGAVVVDDDLEDALREEFGLPNKGTPRMTQPLLPTSQVDQGTGQNGGGRGQGADAAPVKSPGQEGGEQLSKGEPPVSSPGASG